MWKTNRYREVFHSLDRHLEIDSPHYVDEHAGRTRDASRSQTPYPPWHCRPPSLPSPACCDARGGESLADAERPLQGQKVRHLGTLRSHYRSRTMKNDTGTARPACAILLPLEFVEIHGDFEIARRDRALVPMACGFARSRSGRSACDGRQRMPSRPAAVSPVRSDRAGRRHARRSVWEVRAR